MTSLERKLLTLAKISKKMNDLSIAKISEQRYNIKIEKLQKQFKSLSSDIGKEIETLQNELELISVFMKIIMSYGESWYKIKDYVKNDSKYAPAIIKNYVSKILQKEND